MATMYECIGLPIQDDESLRAVTLGLFPDATVLGETTAGAVLRWQDPSGARITFTLDPDDLIIDVVPSIDGAPGASLGRLGVLHGSIFEADVVDLYDETLTRLAMDFERYLLMDHPDGTWSPRTSITALGLDVATFASPKAFADSAASVLSGDASDPAAKHVGHESFIPVGLFGPPEDVLPIARLSGTVVHATRRRNTRSRLLFDVARVRTVGMEVDVCTPAGGRLAALGEVISGTVYLVGSERNSEPD